MRIYLLQQADTNLYKIGVTKKDVDVRIKELQIGNPSKLSLIESYKTKWDFKLENALHIHFKRHKVQSEWFELTEENVKEFLTLCEKYEKNFDVLKEFNNPFL